MHSQLPKCNTTTAMPPVKKPKTENSDLIDILTEVVCYLLSHGLVDADRNLTVKNRMDWINKINKAKKQDESS